MSSSDPLDCPAPRGAPNIGQTVKARLFNGNYIEGTVNSHLSSAFLIDVTDGKTEQWIVSMTDDWEIVK